MSHLHNNLLTKKTTIRSRINSWTTNCFLLGCRSKWYEVFPAFISQIFFSRLVKFRGHVALHVGSVITSCSGLRGWRITIQHSLFLSIPIMAIKTWEAINWEKSIVNRGLYAGKSDYQARILEYWVTELARIRGLIWTQHTWKTSVTTFCMTIIDGCGFFKNRLQIRVAFPFYKRGQKSSSWHSPCLCM